MRSAGRVARKSESWTIGKVDSGRQGQLTPETSSTFNEPFEVQSVRRSQYARKLRTCAP